MMWWALSHQLPRRPLHSGPLGWDVASIGAGVMLGTLIRLMRKRHPPTTKHVIGAGLGYVILFGLTFVVGKSPPMRVFVIPMLEVLVGAWALSGIASARSSS